jgi:hypothetical protein
MQHHISLLKNNSENSRSMLRHISSLKNNSKNSRKSPHPTLHFSIENLIYLYFYDSLQLIHVNSLDMHIDHISTQSEHTTSAPN